MQATQSAGKPVVGGVLIGAGKVLLLTVLMLILTMAGSALPAFEELAAQMDPAASQGLLWGLAAVALVDTLLLSWFILRAGVQGWRLMLRVALLIYGVKTVMTQLEAWYFMTNVTPELLRGLMAMTVPAALLFPPAAAWLWGRWQTQAEPQPAPALQLPRSPAAWAWKVAFLAAVIYPLLFFGFGYYVAWVNPEVRVFYGQPGPAQPFLAHMAATLAAAPRLYPFEVMRGLLWVGLALLVLTVWRAARWEAVLYVGLLFALLPNLGMILPNPLMPGPVRMSHLIETTTSNFLWGVAIAWLLTWRAGHRARPVKPSLRMPFAVYMSSKAPPVVS